MFLRSTQEIHTPSPGELPLDPTQHPLFCPSSQVSGSVAGLGVFPLESAIPSSPSGDQDTKAGIRKKRKVFGPQEKSYSSHSLTFTCGQFLNPHMHKAPWYQSCPGGFLEISVL